MADPGNLKRPLYAPKSGYKQSSPGGDIIAVKRAISRAGWWKWQEFSDDYTNGFAFGDANGGGVWGFQKKRGIDPTGNYGEKTHQALRNAKVPPDGQHPGEPAFDDYAAELYRDYIDTGGGDPEKRVRDKIVEFCNRGLQNPQCWNYYQVRPIDISVTPDAGEIYTDCSGSVIQAYHFAKRETGLLVPDPAKQNWSGYGNTDYYEDDHPRVSGQYKVGDLGHYDGHVTMCILAGDWNSSRWWSFGSEPPSKRELNYRSDFRYVCRPPLT